MTKIDKTGGLPTNITTRSQQIWSDGKCCSPADKKGGLPDHGKPGGLPLKRKRK